MKYVNFLGHKITSWVAIVIIAAFGAFFVYFIWANANESWGYDYVYPQLQQNATKLLTSVSTVGWKTHLDEGYGFELRHPAKYSKTISEVAANSVLGTYPGATIGPLVFVKVEDTSLRQLANSKFNVYWNYKGRNESPKDYCNKGVVDNAKLDIRVASCVKGTTKTNYALIRGGGYDIFVDGASSGYNDVLLKAYGQAGNAVSAAEFTQILSTFKFLSKN
jgi:hypothetical protein